MCVRQTTGTLSRCKQSLNKDDKCKSALLDWVCKEIRKRCATCVEKKKTVLHWSMITISGRKYIIWSYFESTIYSQFFQSIVSKDVNSSSSTQYTNNLCTAHLYCYMVETTNFRRFNMSSALFLISVEPPKRYKTNERLTL